MSEFQNVTVVKQANVYSDGKVTSRTVRFADGSRKTLGIMLPGDYTFSTADREVMEVLAGEVEVLLPGQTAWQPVSAGGQFEIPANASFQIRVHSLLDYCCSYFK